MCLFEKCDVCIIYVNSDTWPNGKVCCTNKNHCGFQSLPSCSVFVIYCVSFFKGRFLVTVDGVLEFVLARLCNLLGDLEVSGLSSWKYWDYGDT